MSPLPDIPRFYTALAEWASCMVLILNLRRKKDNRMLAIVSILALVVQTVFLVGTDNVPVIFWLPCMILAVLLMILFMHFCIGGTINDAVYYGVFAFVAAEFAASFEWQVFCWADGQYGLEAFRFFFVVGVYLAVFLILWKLLKIQQSRELILHVKGRELAAACMIALSVFAMSNLNFLSINTPFSGDHGEAVFAIRTLVDLAGIAMMYAYHVLCIEISTWYDLRMVQGLMQNQYLQYEYSREYIDLLNYKYHDLKHQIAFLRAELDTEERKQYVKQMEDELHSYRLLYCKTGNKVVDTILTDKNVICEKNGISMTYMVDGELLDFMSALDICSILGNALDNAIEYVKSLQNTEKRLIHVTICRKKTFVILKFENYFEGRLETENGIPVSTKKKDFHGFGIRSIQFTVSKYGGVMNIENKDHWFRLKILLPFLQIKGRDRTICE